MFMPAGAYWFRTNDGFETIAATASMGLLHWYMRIVPHLDSPEPIPILEVIQTNKPIPGPYHSQFLVVVIGGIERTYGKSPEINSEFLSREWYNDLSEYSDHKAVVRAYRNADPKVVAYEEVCLSILAWLANFGDISEMKHDSMKKKS